MTKTLIKKEIFLSIIKGELIDNEEYSKFYEITYNRHEEKNVKAIFESIEISDVINLENISEGILPIKFIKSSIYYLNISNCFINKITFKEECKVIKLYVQENSTIENLFIDNSNFQEIEISTTAKIEVLHFGEVCKIDILKICGKETKVNSLTISASLLVKLYVEKEATVLDLLISKKSSIIHLILKGYASFDKIIIKEDTKIYEFITESINIKQEIEIENSFFKLVSIHTNELLEISVDKTFIQEFCYKNNISTTLNLRHCDIVHFLMKEMKTGKDGLIQLLDCKISELKFDTVYNLSSINIRNLEPLKKGEVKFKTNLSETPKLLEFIKDEYETKFDEVLKYAFESEKLEINETAIVILNSDIGKTMFSSDLSSFTKFEFLNSKIIESFIAGPRLPEITSTFDKIESNNLLDQKRIAYNQLKKIYENRGDNITAMDYQAKEMEIYRKQVIKKQDGKIPGESFQLKFNQVTNQHGTQWRRPLFWTIGISISFYLIYYWLLFGFNVGGSFNFNAIPYYFEFLNPTHKTGFIKEFDFKTNSIRDSIALLVDYSSRLIIPLFLYQMVQAFRKYGKK